MKQRGFTLIELLVAMTIVAVLLGMALISYQGARKSARDGKRKADLEEVRSALEMYRTDIGIYPPGPLISGQPIVYGTTTYMTIPLDPISPQQRYYYFRLTNDTYTLDAALEIDTGNNYGGNCGTTCNYRLTNP